jgi:hypothetical protein
MKQNYRSVKNAPADNVLTERNIMSEMNIVAAPSSEEIKKFAYKPKKLVSPLLSRE